MSASGHIKDLLSYLILLFISLPLSWEVMISAAVCVCLFVNN